ncbi:hypothetical protein S40285_09705 [Stachybotrys chlorohalonatus IBT 40285]|uniref:Uncharacterized protein n=1 Tax=Stachybotrys chlorohalonatus (strain IBT 40285) TaxID=1283841 RepID=A0A084QGC9_STAC4|nr:hypothetical protein S40285_09705 [Stachybotrys chlorohalonata IBT 40285]
MMSRASRGCIANQSRKTTNDACDTRSIHGNGFRTRKQCQKTHERQRNWKSAAAKSTRRIEGPERRVGETRGAHFQFTRTSDRSTARTYCTIDISRIEETESEDTSAGAIRNLIETGVRTELGRPDWRCRAVTKYRKSSHRIRIACRNENEHQLAKQVAEAI